MEDLRVVPLVSLVLERPNGTLEKIKFRNSSGDIQDEIDLATLDYFISAYRDLDRYFEDALASHWIDSRDSKVKIIDKSGYEYPLPFDNNNRDLIWRCSESAVISGDGNYIVNGKDPKQVDYSEFVDYFNEFLNNVLSDEGIELIENGYFANPAFSSLLKAYYKFLQNDEDIYARANAAKIEKHEIISREAPSTIEDYLRFYSIFRRGISFNADCKSIRNKKKMEYAEALKEAKIKEEKIKPGKEEYEVKKGLKEQFASKRSLCFVIGNNCEPLILKTDSAEELDDYVSQKYKSSKEVRRDFKDEITAYVYAHKDYVQSIRDLIHNSSYTGQVAILAHDSEGNFIRTDDNAYYRYPVIYSDTFRHVRKLFCNIDKFKKQFKAEDKTHTRVDNEAMVARTRIAYGDLETGLKETVLELEKEEKLSKERLQELNDKIAKIINTMKDLEKADFEASSYDPSRPRMFSKRVSSIVGFARIHAFDKNYKKALDEWAKQIIDSPYRYDHVRFIMRELRKKNDITLEDVDTIKKLDDGSVTSEVYDSMHIEKPINETSSEVEYDREEKEDFLSEDEYKEMYGDGTPMGVDPDNIHIIKEM